MEQSHDGGATAKPQVTATNPYYTHGNNSMKPHPIPTNGHQYENTPSKKYQSPRNMGNPNGAHSKNVKHSHAGTYYGNMHNPHYATPYNPAMMHMNGTYYNPHIVNPPLPPLPPTNPSPAPINSAENSTTFSKPTGGDGSLRRSEDAPQYHYSGHQQQHHSTYTTHQNEGVKCHRCGEKGHIAPACPLKRNHNQHSYPKHHNRVCKYWLNGHCQKGDDCLFVHAIIPDPNLLYPPGAIPMHMMSIPHYKHPAQQAYAVDPNAYFYPPIPQSGYVYDQASGPDSPASTKQSSTSVQSSPHHDPQFEYQNGTNEMFNAPQQTTPQTYIAPPYYPQHVGYDGYGNYSYQNIPAGNGPQSRHYTSQPYQGSKMYQQGGNFYAPQPNYQAPRSANYPPQHSATSSSVDEPSDSLPTDANLDSTTANNQSNGISVELDTTNIVEAEQVTKNLQVENISLSESTRVKEVSPTATTSSAVDGNGPSKGKKKKKNKQNTSTTPLDVPVELPLSERGLRNDTGENNCFLNVVVQALYHMQTFQNSFTQVKSHTCAGDGRCVFCALKLVFSLLSEGDGDLAPVSSESLRKVLSAISTSPLPSAEERYKAGSMDDAAEAHETILRSLHEALTCSKSPCDCIVHDVFGLWVGEEATCRHCGNKMETSPYDAMVLHVATEAMKETLMKHKSMNFESVLASVWSASGSSKKCANCRHDKLYESSLQLKQLPRMFTLGMTWKNNPAHSATLRAIVSSIEPRMNLGRVFPNMLNDKLVTTDQGEAILKGMYCFFGHHYMAFLYKESTKEWLSFNDTVVKRVGTQWNDIQKSCLDNHYQPYVLFYDIEMKKENVLQFTIGDIVLSVPSEIDQENWRSRDENELAEFNKNSPEWCTVGPVDDDLLHWNAMVVGPENTPYSGGVFSIDLVFPAEYPFKAPKVKFLTRVYHPNVKSQSGEICGDIINESWGPTLNVLHCLTALKQMLEQPDADNPLEPEIAKQLHGNRDLFNETARKWTKDFAS